MSLVEFLLARIAEDEELVTRGAEGDATSAFGWHTIDCGVDLGYWATGRCTCRYVERVLSDCEVKRRIVESYGGGEPLTLRLFSLLYVSHPDYDESWRP